MTLRNQMSRSFDLFNDHLNKARIILLHPRSRYRSVLVAQLISAPSLPTFYYALGPDDINVQAFVTGMAHDLANQHPTFGRHTNMIPDADFDNFPANLDHILLKFASDLAEVSEEPFLLILDEYDRSDIADDVQRFVQKLVEYMPRNCTLVINSRTLPRLPWVSFIARNEAAILEDDVVIEENFYDLKNDDQGQLEIYALGPGFVLMDNQYIDAWEGHLPRLLLFFTLDRPVVTRSDICRAFWPELTDDQAVNVFHVTKRRLHKALNLDVLVHEEGYYRINPELSIYFDVLEFAKLLVAGRKTDHEERFQAWERALHLYRGPFLQGHADPWIEERRVDFRIGYLEALTHVANVWEHERSLPEKALMLFRSALSEDPFNASLNCEVLRLYEKLGRGSEAIVHYRAYETAAKEKTITLSDEVAAAYQKLLTQFA